MRYLFGIALDWRKGRVLRVLATISLMTLVLFSAPGQAARPYRGPVVWSILLCKFSDSPAPKHDLAYYQSMFVTPGTGGMDDYLKAVSYGSADFSGTVVKGWYTINKTTAQESALGGNQRTQKYTDCLDAAAHDQNAPYTPPPGQLVAVITSPGIDLFGMIGVGSFLGEDVNLTGMSHEVGHGLGFNHSFSNDTSFQDASWSQPGEYDDPWDMMSAYNVFADPGTNFGGGGPGFNAHHIDEMGWLPRPRIFTAGADGHASSTVTLAALSHPEASGYLIARVPFDPGDVFHYYTVEFRTADGWDGGFPAPIVMIHEIKVNSSDNSYHTYLLRTLGTPDRAPMQSLNANGVTISIGNVDAASHQATVTITTQVVDRCLQGFVWREAFANDHVCVPPATRSQAAADNAQAGNRINPARITYGPNTCKQGFVWREADASDFVCVSGAERTQVRTENGQPTLHRNPGGGPFGPDTCAQGFVWRDAFPGDHICVTPQRRSQVRGDNAQANSRLMKPSA